MNVTDLRDLLENRSAEPAAEVVSATRLTDVRGRIVLRRRRRTVAAVAAAAVAVAAVSVTAVVAPRAYVPPPGANLTPTPGPAIAGFPPYAGGARVVAAADARPPERTVAVTVTPKILDLVFFVRCTDRGPEHELALNGRVFAAGSGCGSSTFSMAPDDLASGYGIRPGQPITVTLTLKMVPKGEFGVAVGEKVDPAVYPYPSAPATLEALSDPSSTQDGTDARRRGGLLLRAHAGDWNRPVSAIFNWPGAHSIAVAAHTPGAVKITVNGVEVHRAEFWTYGSSVSASAGDQEWREKRGLELERGQRVTVTVTPERMRGDWRVLLDPPMPGG